MREGGGTVVGVVVGATVGGGTSLHSLAKRMALPSPLCVNRPLVEVHLVAGGQGDREGVRARGLSYCGVEFCLVLAVHLIYVSPIAQSRAVSVKVIECLTVGDLQAIAVRSIRDGAVGHIGVRERRCEEDGGCARREREQTGDRVLRRTSRATNLSCSPIVRRCFCVRAVVRDAAESSAWRLRP